MIQKKNSLLLKDGYVINGFSLIEMAMVLLIIGIIAGSIFKGKDIVEAAQIRSVANDVNCIRVAYNNYVVTYNSRPGNDNTASDKFTGAENGSGNLQYSEEDTKKVFQHLYYAGLINSPSFKTPKIGGEYNFVYENDQLKLKISNGARGVVNKKQANLIRAKIEEIVGNDVNIDIKEEEQKCIITVGIN
jgi:prepilin-type N-terminal cleavage/methylation domain-containing protein